MKKVFLSAAVIAMVALSFTSCSVEKRHYMKGYHIDWLDNNKNAATHEQASVNTTKEIVAVESAVAVQEAAPAQEIAPVNAPVQAQQSFVAPVAAAKAVAKSAVAKSNAKPSVAQQANSAVKAQVVKQAVKNAASKPAGGKPSKGLLIVLAILIPWLAVGLATDWDVKAVIINLLWSLTCIGGIIHAIIVVNREA